MRIGGGTLLAVAAWVAGADAYAGVTSRPCVGRRSSLVMSSKEDAESDGRLLEALFGGTPEAQAAMEMDPDVASHMKLRISEDGRPVLLRFVYVDELSCIGCTYCADVARSTFYMNEDAGRARVYNQHGDEPEIVQEAIDSCPVTSATTADAARPTLSRAASLVRRSTASASWITRTS